MKKPIIVNDLAHYSAEMIEAFYTQPRLPYDMAAGRDRIVVLSATSIDGKIWYDEGSEIDPEAWKKIAQCTSRLPAPATYSGVLWTADYDLPAMR